MKWTIRMDSSFSIQVYTTLQQNNNTGYLRQKVSLEFIVSSKFTTEYFRHFYSSSKFEKTSQFSTCIVSMFKRRKF